MEIQDLVVARPPLRMLLFLLSKDARNNAEFVNDELGNHE